MKANTIITKKEVVTTVDEKAITLTMTTQEAHLLHILMTTTNFRSAYLQVEESDITITYGEVQQLLCDISTVLGDEIVKNNIKSYK